MTRLNQCMRCGACCVFYRVSFDCGEVDDVPGGVVPSYLTIKLTGDRSAMRGTEKGPIRCQALTGQVGGAVHCTICDRRPSSCRSFLSAWEFTSTNTNCDRARASYGLMPISEF